MKNIQRRRFGIFAVAAALVCCLFAAVLTACKDEPAAQSGAEAGAYYCDAGSEEYLLTLGGEMQFTLTVKGDVSRGGYTLQDEALTLNAGDKTYSATLQGNILSLNYGDAQMRFYKKVYYTVAFDAQGGSDAASVQTLNGKAAQLPADPVRDGYAFIGWYKDAEYTSPYLSDAVTADTTLYARWAQTSADGVEYTVTYDLGYAAEAPAPTTTIGKKLYNAPVPAREGYNFAGWWVSMENEADRLTFRLAEDTVFDADTTLFAVWQAADAETPAPEVSVSERAVTWDAIDGVSRYLVTIIAPDGTSVASAQPTTSTTFPAELTDAGAYRVEVSAATAGGSVIPGATTERYFVGKALSRVSGIEVIAPDTLVFRGVEGAQKYLLTIDCGDDRHVHKELDLGTSLYYNFSNCAMQEGGIRFTIEATAEGYASSKAEFVLERTLNAVQNLKVEDDVLTWNPVAGATLYRVTVGPATFTVTGTQYSLKNLPAGEYTLSVQPAARGYNSPAALSLTHQKTTPVLPEELLLNGTVLSWKGEEGISYSILYDGKEAAVPQGETSYDLAALFGWTVSKDYTVQLKATMGNAFATSEPYTFRFDDLDPVLTYAEGALSWKPVAGALGYEVRVNGDDATLFRVESTSCGPVLTRAGENTLEVRFLRENGASEWASLTVKAYAVTFDSREGSSSVSAVYAAAGDLVWLPTPTAPAGYDFDAWYTSPDGPEGLGARYEDAYYVVPGGLALYASYAPKAVKVTLSGADGLTEATVYYGQEYTLPVPEATDGASAFGGWFGAPHGVGEQYTDAYGNSLSVWQFTEDTTLYAFWVENVLTFTWMGNGYSVRAGARANLVPSITIPAQYEGGTVTQIASSAFANLTSLTSVDIPDTVTNVPASAFEGCTALTDVNVYSAGAAYARYSSQDGVLYDMGAQDAPHAPQPAFMPAGKTGSYRIPDGVTTIPASAFAGSRIERIVIPASVTSIGTEAFANCSNLASVVFEDLGASAPALTIGDRAFKNCNNTNFTSIRLPARLASISYEKYDAAATAFDDLDDLTATAPDAFLGCSNLTRIEVAQSEQATYRTVDGVLFMGNTLLYFPSYKSVSGYTIPETTSAIAAGAFFGVVGFSGDDVVIPASVQTVGDFAFAGCSFSTLTFAGEEGSLGGTAIGNYAFYECAYLEEVTFAQHSAVTEVGDYAFYGCEEVKTLTIPASMTKIGNYAFAGCADDDVLTVTFAERTEALSFGSGVFSECHIEELFIPASVTLSDDFLGGLEVDFINPAEDHPTLQKDVHALYLTENGAKVTLLRFQPTEDSPFPIPASVKTIAASAFEGAQLTALTFKDGSQLESIGERAFYGSSLETIDLPESAFTIGSYAFAQISSRYGDKCTTHIDLGGATSIGDHAFFNTGYTTLKVTIPASVKEIGAFAFADNSSYGVYLAEVTLSEGLEVIGENAFASSGITTVTIPASVKEIGESAFADSKLETIAFAENTAADAALLVGGYILEGTQVASVAFPAHLTELGANAMRGSAITTVTFADNARLETIGANAFNGSALTQIAIPASVREIGESAFASSASLANVTFAEGAKLETIGASAFNSTALTQIAIPASVKEIGESAFASSANLASVTFADNAGASLTIGARAFSSTGITSITLPAQFTGFAANIFYAGVGGTLLASISVSDKNAEYASHGGILYTKDYATLLFCPPEFTGENGTATVHNDTKTIAAEAFKYCSHLTAIDFGTAQVTSVGAEAFRSTGLTSIALPDSVQTIGESAFVNSNSLTTFRVPESLLSFDASTLGLDALTTLTVSDGNDRYEVDQNAALILTDGAEKTLVYYLRSGAPETYAVPAGTTQIGENAFRGAAVSEVSIPASVTFVAANAFNGSALATVTFAQEDGAQLIIGQYAFYNTQLTEVALPARTFAIDDYAFAADSQGFMYDGDVRLASITFGTNSKLNSLGSNVFQYSFLETIDLPASLATMGDGVFRNNAYLVSVRLPEGLTTMGNETFYADDALESVYLPSTLRTMGSGTFSGCEYLTDVTFAEGFTIERLAVDTFSGCDYLEEITLPASLTEVTGEVDEYGNRTGLFEGLYYLTKVTFAEGSRCVEIGPNAFANSSLSEITLPASLTTIGHSAFRGTELESIVIPRTVTRIDAYAFSDCRSLESVQIEPGIAAIPGNAFANCTSLTSITIPASVTSLSASAFTGCSALTDVYLEAGNPAFVMENGVLYTADMTQVVFMPVSVTSFTIPAAMTSADIISMLGTAEGLKEIVVEEGNPVYRAKFGVLYDSEWNLLLVPVAMETYTIPKEVTFIAAQNPDDYYGGNYFSATAIKEIDFEEGRTERLVIAEGGWGQGAFVGMQALTTVTLPANVTIGAYAFYNCNALNSVTLTPGAGTIGNNAFGYTDLKSLTIPEGYTSIGDNIFSYCEKVEEVSLPATLTDISEKAFGNCDSLIDVTVAAGNTVYKVDHDVLYKTDMTQVIFVPVKLDTFYIPADLTDAELLLDALQRPEALASIEIAAENTAFRVKDNVVYDSAWNLLYVCPAITSYTIPKEVVSLPSDGYFYGTGVTSVTFEDGRTAALVLEDGGNMYGTRYGVFVGMNALASVSLPANTTIGAYAFAGLYALKTVTLGENTSIGERAFNNCAYLDTLTFDSKTNIGRNAFSGCKALSSLTFPANTVIGESAFNGCTRLTSVAFASANVTLTGNPFTGCAPVNKITVADSAAGNIVLESGVLYDAGKTRVYLMEKVESFNIPATLTDDSFLDLLAANPNLTSITSDNPDFKVVGGVIHNADMEPVFFPSFVTSYTIPKDVAIDGSYLSELQSLLSGTKVSAVAIEEGNTSAYFADFGALYTSDGTLAFVPAKMETFTISKRATLISGSGLFSGTAVKTVTYDKSEGDPSGKVTLQGTDDPTMASVFNGASVETVELPGWAVIGDYAFYGLRSLTSITLGEGITSIGSNAFMQCLGLTAITLPSTLESIGYLAFYYCDYIATISIPASVTTMGSQAFAFWGTYSTQTIYVPFAEGELPAGWDASWAASVPASSIIYAEAQEPTE